MVLYDGNLLCNFLIEFYRKENFQVFLGLQIKIIDERVTF